MAFSLGACVGASLLCRSALESAAYEYYRRGCSLKDGAPDLLPGELRPVPTRGEKGPVATGAIREAAQKAVGLSREQVAAWDAVQRRGNFGAHTAETVDQFYQHFEEARDRDLMEKRAFTPVEYLWVSEKQALEDIRTTAEILGILEDALYGPPEPR